MKKLEPDCEDYGQAVIYKGTIENNEDSWILDDHHIFIKDKISLVCGNTWLMLQDTRFKNHFQFIGDFTKHFGIFPNCGKTIPFLDSDTNNGVSGGCC